MGEPINKPGIRKPIERFGVWGANRLKPSRLNPCQSKVKANGCLLVTPERSRLDFALPFFNRLALSPLGHSGDPSGP